ncbi:MAG: SAM-dependent methyltransferase [Intrasporangium sp.]|uniref:SAM-dependent methyltransferase n=1 Tax=Intrasporangium sp. TaxID=1925024 RepID=UPI003F7DF2E7
MSSVPWRVAWQHALYDAELGFYVTRGGPSAHFATAAQGPTGRVLAEALLRLWHRHHPDRPPSVIVDIGAGRGELTNHLAALTASPTRTGRSLTSHTTPERSVRPEGGGEARVVGVDVVDRPDGLDAGVEWVRSPGGAHLPDGLTGLTDALVVAHEWLDVVPCTIAEVAADGGLREVLVEPGTGAEQLGPVVTDADTAWVEQYWPDHAGGGRIEIGRTRDEAWADLLTRVDSGLVVGIDYGHVRSGRPSGGTLAAYREGHLVPPVPDGTCDLTAHVAMDSLGAEELHRQRDLLVDLGFEARTPDHTAARTDPIGYLRALERASAEARLIDRSGFGAFWWAVKQVGSPHVP